jgi:hypothetical protein
VFLAEDKYPVQKVMIIIIMMTMIMIDGGACAEGEKFV